jgi:hypothetical protein
MNKRIVIIVLACILAVAIGCSALAIAMGGAAVSASSIENYGRIFNSTEYKDHEVRVFLKGAYYSYLFAFPEVAPDGVEKFEFEYRKNVFGNLTAYAVLSYKLSETDFNSYKGTLKNYSLYYKSIQNRLLYNDEIFEYPAYVFEYMSEGDGTIDGGVAEYVLLDEAERRVICVYYCGMDAEKIADEVGLPIAPSDRSVEAVTDGRENIIALYRGYSVYCFVGSDGKMDIPSKDSFGYAS